MIFEFLKRLFWTADEGSRKRKSNETTPKSGEDHTLAKKRCFDLMLSNEIKIVNESNESCNHKCIPDRSKHKYYSSANVKQCNSEVQNKKNFRLPESTKMSLSTMKLNRKDIKSTVTKAELHNQFTLYETHRLSEKKQYSDMILNFLSQDGEPVNDDLQKTVNHQNSKQKVSTKPKLDTDNQCFQSFKYTSQANRKSWISSDKHKNSKLQSPKSADDLCFKKLQSQKSIDDLYHQKQNEESENSVNPIIRNTPIEIIKTNTLRDQLSSKMVIKQNFVSKISEKYDERFKQRYKEAEELKKLTYILSKHNQLTREATLEDHLNRSMRLCEAVLDERPSEEESKLPELTSEMLDRIKLALSVGPGDEILVQGFGLRITRKDIQTLAGLNWLNDEVINFYMNLLITRGNSENYPNVYAMNTFFYPKLLSGGHASLKRWTRKVDIFSKDILVVPIHLGIHWCMSIIDFRSKSIQYFDSMGSPNNKCLQVLKQYLHDESIDKKKVSFDFIDWSFECIKDIPQQMNGSDCGVFSCMFAEYICANKKINFTQEDMPYFRNKMVYEILTVQLL